MSGRQPAGRVCQGIPSALGLAPSIQTTASHLPANKYHLLKAWAAARRICAGRDKLKR